MPRNKSERPPGLIWLTTSTRLNQYITDWYDWVTSKAHPEDREYLYEKTITSQAALTGLDTKAWDEISPDGDITGEELKKLCHAAKQK